MIFIDKTMRRHALASGFRFVLWDRFTGVPVKLPSIALMDQGLSSSLDATSNIQRYETPVQDARLRAS
jgi:hypothetical protein